VSDDDITVPKALLQILFDTVGAPAATRRVGAIWSEAAWLWDDDRQRRRADV